MTTTLMVIPTPRAFEAVRAMAVGCALNLPVGKAVAVVDTVKSVAYHYSPHPPNAESGMPGVDVAAYTLDDLALNPDTRIVTADAVFDAGIKDLLA